ncbi:hypothetical protein [Streptomyces sp. NPDC058542]|uniref:hypothetical protein n=1 Tax=Streptomyces sp. NPDC058542 TaxID=3346543 RepID=UPI00365C12CF
MKVYKVKGITDDVTECGLCGRIELKGTVVLASLDADGNEDGGVDYFGTHCASKAAGWTVHEVNERVREAARRERNEARERAIEAKDRETREYKEYLRKCYGDDVGWAVRHYGTYTLWQDFRASKVEPPKVVCDRKACTSECPGDALYCSDECFDLDNASVPVQPIVRNKVNGFGVDLCREFRQPVVVAPVYYVSIEEPVEGFIIDTFRNLTEKEARRKIVEYQACYGIDTDLPAELHPMPYVVDVRPVAA